MSTPTTSIAVSTAVTTLTSTAQAALNGKTLTLNQVIPLAQTLLTTTTSLSTLSASDQISVVTQVLEGIVLATTGIPIAEQNAIISLVEQVVPLVQAGLVKVEAEAKVIIADVESTGCWARCCGKKKQS